MTNCKTSPTSNIIGVIGSEKISQLWQEHYCDLFTCVKSNLFGVGNIDNNEDVIVNPHRVQGAVMKLGDNWVCSMDNMSAQHLKLGNKKASSSACFLFYWVIIPSYTT